MTQLMTDKGLRPAEDVINEVLEKNRKWVFREEAVQIYGGNSSYFSTWYEKHKIPTKGHRNNKRWDADAIRKAKGE